MTPWPKRELRKIGAADDLYISPFRSDGVTYGTPTWVWSVVIEDALYVRAYNGTNSRWYKSAVHQKAGRITAAGITREVAFAPVGSALLNDRIDAAYREKYSSSDYLDAMIGRRARSSTIKIMPRIKDK